MVVDAAGNRAAANGYHNDDRPADPLGSWAQRYVLVSLASGPATGGTEIPAVSFFQPQQSPPVEPSRWTLIQANGQTVPPGDKPCLVGGRTIQTAQGPRLELHVTYASDDDLYYLRSTDGGASWKLYTIPGASNVSDMSFVTAAQNGTLYVSYLRDDWTWRFVRIQVTDPASDQIAVTHLANSDGFPLTLAPTAPASVGGAIPLPGFINSHSFALVPIALKPSDPNNEFYLCYHDVVDPNPPAEKDVNVYFHRVTRNPATDRWTLGTKQKVHSGEPLPSENVTDQWVPSMLVTPDDRIHIYWYDDRLFDQLDGTTDAQVDAYYAWSDDGGTNFLGNLQLTYQQSGIDDRRVLNLKDGPVNEGLFELGEYMGIAYRPTSFGYQV